jgi:molybdenum cofactor cytidylyltransferase
VSTSEASPGLFAVILAAGASRRMGQPKAGLDWRGRSFLSHCVALARTVLSPPQTLFVIEGAFELDPILASVPPGDLPVTKLTHPGWRDGPLSSLQQALHDERAQARPCLVLTVDRPHIHPATLRHLVEAHAKEPEALWQPSYRGGHGHPIIWPSDLCLELRALPPQSSPRTVIARPEVARRRRFVAVDDAAVCDNIDDPGALSRLRRLTS